MKAHFVATTHTILHTALHLVVTTTASCCYYCYRAITIAFSTKQLDTLPVSVTDKQAMRDTIAKYQSKIVQYKKGLIKAAAASALATGTKAAEVCYTILYTLYNDAKHVLIVKIGYCAVALAKQCIVCTLLT
jgi:hypothetical protein